MLNFASKMINNLIGVPGEDGQPVSNAQQQSQQSMGMRNPQMGGPQQQRPMFQAPGPQGQRPGFPGQQGQQRPSGPHPGGVGPGFAGPRPPGLGGRPPGPGMGPGGPGGPGMGPGGPGMGPQRFGGPGPRGNGPRGPPGGGPRMMMQGPGGPQQQRGPPGMGGPRSGGPMGPPGGPMGPSGNGPGRFYPPNRPPGQGPPGPQGQLRGPYPGSSPPGQQMRGPMMANNAAGQQQARPPYFGTGGPAPNQGPGIRGPPGTTTRPGLFQQGQQQHQMMPGQQSMIGGSSMQQASVNNTGVPGGVLPDVDMSHLSEEERMLIESVMAKAQMEELELEQSVVKPPTNSRMMKGQLARQISQPDPLERENELRYSIDPSSNNSTSNGINRRTSMSVTDMSNLAAINNQQQRLCSVCCRRDISGRDGPPGQACAECRTVVCTTCGGYAGSSYDNKAPFTDQNTVWLCRTCLDRRQNLNWSQQPNTISQQSTTMKSSMMNDASGHPMGSAGRQQQQQTMREYNLTSPSDTTADIAPRSASSLITPAAATSLPVTYHPTAPTSANSPPSFALNRHSSSPTVAPSATQSASSPKCDSRQECEPDNQSDSWFQSVYQREDDDEDDEEDEEEEMKRKNVLARSPGEDGGNQLISPVSYTSHRPFVDDSHRLRYQDIEDDEMHSNGSEENNHQGKDADDSDNDSLLEELATVAVKEGSDSDENLSDVEELNHCKDDTAAGNYAAAEAEEADSSSASSPRSAAASPSPGSPPTANMTAALQHVYEHNPGEVYPIAEEEEEAASPTASDGVTSLRCRARLNSGSGIEGSAMGMFNDQMTTANAQMRIGSPTNPLYNRSSASSSVAANQTITSMAGALRGVNPSPSSSLPSSNSASNLMSHFGSSAIRFRSANQPSDVATTTSTNSFKDERMPTSPPATGMMTASGNHFVQQQQQQQQPYNNEMLHDQLTHQQQQQQQQSGGKPAGTITGMLADFSRALGLGSNATRSSDQTFGQLNDSNQQLQQQQNAAKMNAAQSQQQQLQMQQQLQQQQMLQSGMNPQQQQQQGPNMYFSADGSSNVMANQSVNPFTGQLQGQQQTMLQPQTGLPGQQLQTSTYNPVFANNALSQMDQQMALQQQQQQLQLQQQQQLGQHVGNNPIMVNENAAGPLFQQNKQLTQINSISSNAMQQQPYALVNTTAPNNYVQQVAQQFEQSGVAAVIASQQPINQLTGMEQQNLFVNQPQSSAFQMPGAIQSVGMEQQLHRPLAQQQTPLVQQQQQQLLANNPQSHMMNDPTNRMAVFNQQQQLQSTALAAGQAQQQQQQQSIQQQQMMQQAAVQLQQQQSIIQQQQQQLLMMNNTTNQDFMQMQHQAQHSKKMRKLGTAQNAALELQQQQFMVANKMTPQTIRKNMLAQQQQQQQAPSASLLHQSSIVPDPNKMNHGMADLYGSSSTLRSADLLHKSRIRLIDGRPYSPTASPEIDMLGMRPGPAAHSFMIGGGTPITTPMGTPAGTPRGGAHSRDSRDLLACDSPDTLSETDSQASLRLRRKLPLLPPDQEAALLPSVQKKKMELAKSQQQQQQQLVSVQERIKAYSNLRQGSLTEAASATSSSNAADRGYASATSATSFSGLTRPTSETNLRQLAYGGESMASSLAARPGSALGLLQGSSIVNANGLRSTLNSNLTGNVGAVARSNPSISVKSEDQTLRESLAAILPPDLRHLVGAPSTSLVTASTTNDSTAILSVGGYRTAALEDLRGSPLTRRRALEEELHRLTEDRARFRNQTDKDRERELRIRRELEKFTALRDPMKRFDAQRRPGSAAAGLIGAQSSGSSVSSRLRKSRGHRRQLSDPRVSSLMREREESSDRYSTARSQSMSRAKAYEYESMEELNSSMAGVGISNKSDWDRHRSIPTSYSGSALNRLLTEDDDFLSRKYSASNSRRSHARRSSDGGMTMTDYLMDPSLVGLSGSSHHQNQSRSRYSNDPRMLTRGLSYDIADRSGIMLGGGGHHGHANASHSKSILLSRKPRSWHPSPYGSDEEFLDAEDDILTREAKKQRIKAEIARRRQQIEQNSRLHDELLRLSRLRECGDVSGYQTNHGLSGGNGSGGPYGGGSSSGNAGRLAAAAASNSSVLRSINDILREDREFIHRSRSSSSGSHLYQPDYGGHHHHVSPTRRPYHMSSVQHQYGSHSRGASPARGAVNYSGVPTEEERSMERLASTFRTEDYTSSLYERLHDFSPLASDPELGGGVGDMMMYNSGSGGPTAMPLLPDMPSRSRKLLEDLAYASASNDAPTMHIQSRGYDYSPEGYGGDPCNSDPEESNRNRSRRSSYYSSGHKGPGKRRYPFPTKRILLTCDAKSSATTDNGLGMRVVGGLEIPGRHGEIGAFVTEISPGGVVDTHGEVQEGDQVLEWNGIQLNSKSFEEVQSIISSTRGEVEIVICGEKASAQYDGAATAQSTRTMHVNGREEVDMNGNSSRHHMSGELSTASPTEIIPPQRPGPQQPVVKGIIRNKVPKPEECLEDPEVRKRKWTLPLGQVQVLSCYDSRAHILYVTIIRARKLQTRRPNGDARPDPLVRCVLLPGRKVENERRTRYLSLTSDPEWHQTMVYPAVPPADLPKRQLEVTVWHHQCDGRLEFLGEFLLDLANPGTIDEQPHWYPLQDNSGGLASLPMAPDHGNDYSNGKPAGSHQRSSMARASMSSGLMDSSSSGCHGAACTIL